MSRALRVTLWLAGGIASFFLIIVIGAWVYSRTDHFRTLLREQAIAAVRDSIDGEVSVERITGSIWTQVQLHNISVRQNDSEVISLPRLSVEVSLIRQALSFLVSSTLHVARIELSQPVIRLTQDQNGKWNIASLFKHVEKPEEPKKVSVFLDQIKLDHGLIEARLSHGKPVKVSSISGLARLDLLASGLKADVPELNFAVAAEGVPPINWSSSFSAETTGSPSFVDIRQLSLRSPESQVRISGQIRELNKPEVSLALELDRVAASELRTLAPQLPLKQDLSGSIKLSGPASDLRASGDLKFPNGQLTPVVIADLTQTEPRVRGSVDARSFDIDKVLAVPQISGRLNGRLSFDGTNIETGHASTRASVTTLTVKEWQVGDLQLSAEMRGKKIVAEAILTSKNGQARMDSQIALAETPSYEANLKIRNLDVRNIAQGTSSTAPLAGSISLDGWFKGRGTEANKLDASSRIKVLPSRFGPLERVQGDIVATLRQGVLTLNQTKLASQGTTIEAQGKLSVFSKSPNGQITYVARIKEVAPWLALAGFAGQGSISVDGSAAGSMNSLALEGKANLSGVQLPGTRFESGSLAWKIAGIGSSRPNGTIKAGTREIDAGIHLRALSADLSIAGTNPMNVGANVIAEDREKRTHRLRAQVQHGSEFSDFLIEQLALQLPTGAWRISQPARLRLKDKQITTNDLRLESGPRSVRVNGVFALNGTQDLQLRINGFPLDDLEVFLTTDPRVGGDLNIQAEVRGTAARPVLTSKVSVERLSIAGQPYAGVSGDVVYQNERLTLDATLRQDASHFLTAKGGIPVYLGWGGEKSVAVLGEADLRVHSDGLNPAFFGMLSSEVDNIGGNLVLDIRLRGPADALRPTGTVELQQAQARVKPLGVSLTAVEVQARMVPGAVQLTRVSARSGEGQLSGGGKIALKNYTPAAIDLTLDADRFRVSNTPEYVAAISGRLTASGSQEQPFLRGKLTLTDTKLRPNLEALRQKGPPARDPTIVVVKNEVELAKVEREATNKKPPENTFYQRLGLDIVTVIPRDTWVYLDEGSIELMGRVNVRKDPQKEITVTGTVESVRGWYAFQGKQFRVEKAQILFTGGSTIDPSLDAVGRYKVSQYQIDLVIGGTAKKPTLTLRSEPTMEQADILAVLLFGRPVNGLSEGQRVSLQQQALQTTANYIASGLRQSVANRLGLDNLELGFGETVAQPRIGVGKYVTENIYVSGTQQVGGDRQQEYSVEYNLAPSWQLKGSTNPQGKSGVDLMWRKKY